MKDLRVTGATATHQDETLYVAFEVVYKDEEGKEVKETLSRTAPMEDPAQIIDTLRVIAHGLEIRGGF